MSYSSDFLKSSLVDETCARIRDRLGPQRSGPAERLARQYLAGVPSDDFDDMDCDQLFAVTIGFLSFMKDRPCGTPKLRLFDPDPERNGWCSVHSVIEIVNDDMPFLVDSVAMVLARAGIAIHLLVHPVVRVVRGAKGKLEDVLEPGEAGGHAESLMHLQIDRQEPETAQSLLKQIQFTLDQVRLAVTDWRDMRACIKECAGQIGPMPGLDQDEAEEAVAFLDWLHDDHFTFLGHRHFTLSHTGDNLDVGAEGEGLGILRTPDQRVFDDHLTLAAMPVEIRAFLTRPGALLITKSARMSTVHRDVHMDVVGVKRFDAAGCLVGLDTFLGLFTSAAYTRNPASIPLIRRKVGRVRMRAGFNPTGHDSKALTNILDTYPRDELFQIDEEGLFQTAIAIVHLQERPKVALFLRKDEFERFMSCLVFLPRDRFDTALRLNVIRILEAAYAGPMDAYYTQVSDGPLARLHVLIRTQPGAIPAIDRQDLEARIADCAKSWSDQVQIALVQTLGEGIGLKLARRWRDAFPLSYRERHSALGIVSDVERLEAVLAGTPIALHLYRPLEAPETSARLKLIHKGSTIALSDILPMLEAMGVKVIAELPHEIRPADHGFALWIHDFQLESVSGQTMDLDRGGARFEETLTRVWLGQAESDGFNRLVLTANLDWRDVVVLRAYAKYLRQAGSTLSQTYMERALSDNPAQALALVTLFKASFDPAHRFGDACFAEHQAKDLLDKVTSADDDRILRRFFNLIRATLRTNFFLDRDYLSFKLDSQAVEDLPLPRPWVEIFVYSPRMEGIHLRGGRVARGGIRWSDRREDFRTEILGLMKAQMVKNAVIVPVGAKGGFVVKRPPAEGGRDALQAEGIACYQTLIRGLLDLTDNLKGGQIIPPRDVVRKDGDDPYLVVAADKGTATFSDIANAISLDYGHWLGDAFASGGSKGYDHKAMGITARGAWEAVKRHFREMGADTQTQDFTAIGIGDMSGDVFGNAMLCSPHIRLVAAFNHSHIFIDPNPDPAQGFAERQRLFKAVKSWPDYDASLISPGGGIFPRSAKSIPISPQMQDCFGLTTESLPPSQLIRHLLTQPVDLLFFGGIGTYVKSSRESQSDAGDRANDAIRVDGRDIRAKVVGEGANLGCTQLGRIEAAQRGCRLNTDAIDNSAGVDCSDHEVNIKILLNEVVAAGDLTLKQRDHLLSAMTDDVARLVLRDNYLQTQAISVMESQAAELLDGQGRFMRMLEKAGRLDRAIEFLPDEETLTERAGKRQGLVRPELAVLLAYAKIWLHDGVLASNLPDDPFLAGDLARYFPAAMQNRFGAEISSHRLRREIVATHVTNSMINRVGVSFVADMMEKTGLGAADVARAYIVARDAYGLRAIWAKIESLDGQVPATTQTAMLVEANRLLQRATAWVLRWVMAPFDIGATIAALRPGIARLDSCVPQILPSDLADMLAGRVDEFRAQGVPAETAAQVGNLIVLASAADVVRIATRQSMDVVDAGRLYFAVGERFGLGWLRLSAQKLAVHGYWQKLAAAAATEDLHGLQRDLTSAVAQDRQIIQAQAALEDWILDHHPVVERVDALMAELRASPQVDLSMLIVAGRMLKTLLEG